LGSTSVPTGDMPRLRELSPRLVYTAGELG
jgi:hypothetical protein